MKYEEQQEWYGKKQHHCEHGGYHSKPPTSALLHHVENKKIVKMGAFEADMGLRRCSTAMSAMRAMTSNAEKDTRTLIGSTESVVDVDQALSQACAVCSLLHRSAADFLTFF